MGQQRVPSGVPSGGQFVGTAHGEAEVALGAGETTRVLDPLLGDDPPLIEHERVFHVGTLDPGDREAWSYEGDGLSVSVHPEEWAHIAKLPGGTHELVRRGPDGQPAPLRFVAWHDLGAEERDRIRTWGVEQGWIEQRTVHRLTWMSMDDNGDPALATFEHEDIAEIEAEAEYHEVERDDPDTRIETLRVWRPTATFPAERVDADDDPTDLLLAHHVKEHRPDLDGVWWEDPVGHLTAPRGGLVRGLEGYEIG